MRALWLWYSLHIFGTVGKFSRSAAVAWNTYGQCHPLNKREKSRNHLLKIKSGVRDPLETGCTIQNPSQLQWKPSLHTAWPSRRQHRVRAWCLVHSSGLYSCTTAPHFNSLCELLTRDELSEIMPVSCLLEAVWKFLLVCTLRAIPSFP